MVFLALNVVFHFCVWYLINVHQYLINTHLPYIDVPNIWANDFITSPIHVNKSPTINIKESWNLAARIGMKISEAIILTILLRWSPYILDCFSWLLDCLIYLRLRKNDMFVGSEPKPGRFWSEPPKFRGSPNISLTKYQLSVFNFSIFLLHRHENQ